MFQPFKNGQLNGRPLTRVNVTGGRTENSNLPSTIVADVRLKGVSPSAAAQVHYAFKTLAYTMINFRHNCRS